ncbi:MAG: hypothetical protein J6C23_03685 [Clostridia bacterium]|nr:hypothetical protein [Clostridia bacterium]
MTSVFPKSEEELVFATRKKLRIIYFSILALFVCAFLFMIIFNIIMVDSYRDRSYVEPFKWISVGISVVFGWYSIFFWSTTYKYTKNYALMFKNIKEGLKDKGEGVFTGYTFEIRTKDGVEFYSMKLRCEPKDRRYDSVARELLVYREVPPIPLAYGQKIKFITHSNILIAFEADDPTKTANADGQPNKENNSEE